MSRRGYSSSIYTEVRRKARCTRNYPKAIALDGEFSRWKLSLLASWHFYSPPPPRPCSTHPPIHIFPFQISFEFHHFPSSTRVPLILRFFSWPQPTDRPTNLPTNFSSPLHIDLETTDGPRRCFPLFPLPLYLAFIFLLFYCAANRTSRRAQRQWSKSKRGESRLVVRHRGIEEREGRRDSFSWFQHWRATLVSGTEERETDIGAFDGR